MATLFDLAQQYLNRALPETFKYDRTNQPGIPTPVPVQPEPRMGKLLPRPGGNPEGFSVYNPDPNRTRTSDQYSPYNYRQAAERNLIGDFYSSGTEAQKLMDSYPEYYTGPQLTGIPGAIVAYAKNSLPGKIIGGVANFVEDKLPVNNRAILENELLGQGFQLNDIGQFVSDGGDAYKEDGSNIMAGYNAAKVTRQTFDKRRAKAKKNMTPEGFSEFNKALTAAEDKFFGGSAKATTVFNDKLKQKDIDDGFINDQIPTYDEEIKTSTYTEDDDGRFITDDSIVSNNIIGGKNLNDYEGIMSTYTPGPGDLGYIAPNNSILANNNINRIKDYIEIPSNDNDNNAGFNPGVTPGNSGFIGIDKDMDVNPFDYDDAGTYEPPSNNYPDYSDVKTGGPPSQGGGGGGPPSQGGTHCCTAANERGDMTLTEVKKLRAWHRKQSKIWQKGYDVWGKVIADNLVAKFKWQSDRVRDFYNHKIYGKRTIGSIYADIVIYPMSMIIGSILTVMPPILGYQENKRHGKSSS